MTDTAGKRSFVANLRDDLRALTTKQIVAIILTIAICLILEVVGLGGVCIGFLIIAVVLYMIPHLMKVTSVGVKAIVGVVFVVLSVLIGTFAYAGTVEQTNSLIEDDEDRTSMRDFEVTYNEEDGNYYMTFEVNPTTNSGSSVYEEWDPLEDGWWVLVQYGDITMISFGGVSSPSELTMVWMDPSELTEVEGDEGWYRGSVQLTNVTDGKYEYIALGIVDGSEEDYESGERITVKSSTGFTVDTGLTTGDIYKMCLYGSGFTTLLVALMFFIILVFSALMRGGANRSRKRMEAEGRLYPQGYGRCKECGAMVLPGEVVCRKCGAYIEVPEELRRKKMDYVVCSECGAEVPADASVCPKCGAAFDEAEEVEVDHADGTVEVTTETAPCPHCGESIPANASWCPKCGKKVKD